MFRALLRYAPLAMAGFRWYQRRRATKGRGQQPPNSSYRR